METNYSLASLVMRVGFGVMMITHGYGKFLKLMGGDFSFADPIGLGPAISLVLTVIAEFICSILVIIGFKTKWVAIPPAFTMLIAALVIHADDPWRKKEFALLYLVGFLGIMLLGSGKYSLDWRLKKV